MEAFLKRAKEFWLRPRRFEQLFPFNNLAGCLAAIVAGMIISFFLFGFWLSYWQFADMDFMVVYNAFLLNDGLSQEYFDHPGYFSILFLSRWFQLLRGAGLLDVHALSALPPPGEADAAWTAAVRAGRVLSLGLSIGFVLAFAGLLRRLIADWRIVALAVFFIAFSGGLAMHERYLRTELFSAGLVTISFLILLIAARRPHTPWRPLLVGLGALFATLALINKIQVIVIVCALPLIVLAFGSAFDDPGGFWRKSRRALPLTALLAVCVVLISIPAGSLVWFGLSAAGTSGFPWRPFLGGMYGFYQPIIAIWFALAMIAFAVMWRVGLLETLAAMLAVVGGIALGLLSLDLHYHPQNVLTVMNPLEQLRNFAVLNETHFMPAGLIGSLVEGVGVVLARRSYIFYPSPRPTLFLEWFVVAATFMAWKAGDRKLAMQAGVIMLVVWGFDLVATLRALKLEYFIYTDLLVVIAAAWLFTHMDLRHHRLAFQVGVLLIGLHIVVGQSEPVRQFLKGAKADSFCDERERAYYLRRIERLPYCPSVLPARTTGSTIP